VDEYARVLKTLPRVKANLESYFAEYAGLDPSYYSTIRFAPSQTSQALIIHDTGDEEAPYAHAVRVNQLWPNSELITTNGLGHKLRDISVVNDVVRFLN